MDAKRYKSAAFETANGESIVTYYNPLCDAGKYEADGTMYMTQPKICVNMIFDLNGTKGPNTFGKDIGFMSAIYSSDSVVVMPTVSKVLNDSTTQLAAGRLCKGNDDETRLPNNEELFSIFANRKLLGLDSTQRHYWSSTVSGPNTAWLMGIHHGGIVSRYERDNGNYFAVCVKR